MVPTSLLGFTVGSNGTFGPNETVDSLAYENQSIQPMRFRKDFTLSDILSYLSIEGDELESKKHDVAKRTPRRKNIYNLRVQTRLVPQTGGLLPQTRLYAGADYAVGSHATISSQATIKMRTSSFEDYEFNKYYEEHMKEFSCECFNLQAPDLYQILKNKGYKSCLSTSYVVELLNLYGDSKPEIVSFINNLEFVHNHEDLFRRASEYIRANPYFKRRKTPNGFIGCN